MNWSQQLPDRTTYADCKDLDAARALPADGIHHVADGFRGATTKSECIGQGAA